MSLNKSIWMGLALLVSPALVTAQEQSPAKKAIVVLSDDAGELHAGINVSGAYSSALSSANQVVSNQFGAATSMNNVAAGAVGGAIGGLIVGAMIASGQQKQADAAIAPLTVLLTEKEQLARVQTGVREALASEGITDIDFILAKRPTGDMMARLKLGDDVATVLFIDSDAKEGWANSLLTITADNRSLRLAAKVDVYQRGSNDFKKMPSRRINLFTPPLAATQANVALSQRVTYGAAGYFDQVQAAAQRITRIALSSYDNVAVADADEVAFINVAGAFAAPGLLIKQDEYGIEVMDKRGNIAVFTADTVLEN